MQINNYSDAVHLSTPDEVNGEFRRACTNPSIYWRTTLSSLARLKPSVPRCLLNWGSLTLHLTELAGGQFGVIPLSEYETELSDVECQALGLISGSRGWVREVYLTGQGVPWVFARTVIPEQVLLEEVVDFRRLGNRSIGSWLFGKLNFQRSDMQFVYYDGFSGSDQMTCAPLWMRRSCFERADLRILISEVFLSAYWDVASDRP